jgi:hypothetical protein
MFNSIDTKPTGSSFGIKEENIAALTVSFAK